MIEGKRRHRVTLIVETENKCEDEHSDHDLLRYFKIHNEFQINQTFAKIIVAGVNDAPEKRIRSTDT
jgi:hypothetical protein